MDKILHGMDYRLCYQDDVLTATSIDMENLRILEEMLRGLLVKKCKLAVVQKEIVYLLLKTDMNGLHPITDAITSVTEDKQSKRTIQWPARGSQFMRVFKSGIFVSCL